MIINFNCLKDKFNIKKIKFLPINKLNNFNY